MSNKSIYILQKARELGLTKREFEANYDVYQDTYGFYCRKKDVLLEREERLEREQDRLFWEAFAKYSRG